MGRAVGTETVSGILGTIGNTPIVKLERLLRGSNLRVFAKLERFNPAGSIKDRAALSMLNGKIQSGELQPGRSVIVESSSGNLGIGLAQACRYFGMRFVCVVDAKTTRQNIAILHAYGAEVDVVTDPDPATGEFLSMRLARVRELLETIPNAYWPDQYSNPLNSRAHHQTMREIADALDGQVDYLFCATSTCGTLTGCAEYVRWHGLPTTVVAVDAIGSVLFGLRPGRRLIPGHGASVRPLLLDVSAADRVIHISDVECVVGCHRLVSREGILAGGSSGAIASALEKTQAEIPDNSNCVMILPDGGDRYLDTIYSSEWVTAHFGDISEMWAEPATMEAS
jgi:2,3-diaminopropionate biosynthesis protein SbnA